MQDSQLVSREGLTPLSSGCVFGLVLFGTFFPLNLPYSNCHSLAALCQEHTVILKVIALIPSL